MEITIPGTGTIDIKNILLDFNGTIALDGRLIPGAAAILNELSGHISIHVITADTFGSAEAELKGVACTLATINPDNQSEAKLKYLDTLGRESTACMGNGKNDRLMLEHSVLGIGIIQMEGAFTETLLAADIIFPDIISALDIFRNTRRLVATLRD